MDDFEEFSNELDLRAGRQLTDRLRSAACSTSVGKERRAGITLSPTNQDIIPGLGVVAEFDTRDSLTNPKHGSLNSVDAPANGWARRPTTRRSISTSDDISRLPAPRRRPVFAPNLADGRHGQRHSCLGGFSHRRDQFPARLGHRRQAWQEPMAQHFEYRYDLVKRRDISVKGLNVYAGVQLAIFADAGSAWNESEEFSRNFIGGVGFGIRLIVPYVNLVRIDFGFGQSGQGMIPHFGVLEKAVYQRRRVR